MAEYCAKRKIVYGIIAVVICLFCTVILSACNGKGKENESVSEFERSLYLHEIVYNEEELTMCAVVTFKGDESKILSSKLNWKSTTYPLNVLFKEEDVAMTVDASAVYDEIEGRLTDADYIRDGVEYNHLKVELRYDTIYKSISSDGEVTKSGRYYLHFFEFDEDKNEQAFSLHLKTQITANWYTLLIVCVLALAVVLLAVTLAIKGKLWQKKKK
ncbi:MAG: hypothetical protein K2N18_05460 [Clostridia bacterium]|nr:hypothetical protein [Clostridia bacterium]